MTAISAMKSQLFIIQSEMMDCVEDSGYVRNKDKYKYQILMKEKERFETSIKWMEELLKPVEVIS